MIIIANLGQFTTASLDSKVSQSDQDQDLKVQDVDFYVSRP